MGDIGDGLWFWPYHIIPQFISAYMAIVMVMSHGESPDASIFVRVAHRKSKTPGQASQCDLSPMSPGILEGPLIKHARNPDQKFLEAPSGFHQLNLGLKLKSLKPSWLMIIDIIGDCTTQCIADDHSV